MKNTLKHLGLTGALAGALAGSYACSGIDHNPTGIPIHYETAVITDPCRPAVTMFTDDPSVKVYFSDKTQDHCGYLTPPPGQPVPPSGKYVCPVLELADAPIGQMLIYQLDSATGPNTDLVNRINAQRGNQVVITQYPKRVRQGGQNITALTYPYDVTGGNKPAPQVEEGTWINNAEQFDPTAPENIRESYATQVNVGVGGAEAGLENLLINGTLRIGVTQRGQTMMGSTQFSRTWYVPNTGIPTATEPVKYIGGAPQKP